PVAKAAAAGGPVNGRGELASSRILELGCASRFLWSPIILGSPPLAPARPLAPDDPRRFGRQPPRSHGLPRPHEPEAPQIVLPTHPTSPPRFHSKTTRARTQPRRCPHASSRRPEPPWPSPPSL